MLKRKLKVISQLLLATCCLVSCTIQRVNDEQQDRRTVFDKDTGEQILSPNPAPQLSQYTNPAIASLIRNANNDRQAGNLQSAVNTLERALRISPNSAEVYYHLSSIRLQQDQDHLALQLARKGKSLLSGDMEGSDLDRELRQLLDNIRSGMRP